MGKFNEKYGFSVGKRYPVVRVESPQAYVDSALRAESAIAVHQRNGSDGVFWLDNDTSAVNFSLYAGDAGITYFYLKLYQTLGEPRFKAIAQGASDYLAEHWRQIPAKPNNEWLPSREKGFYPGLAGVGAVLLEAYRVFDDDTYLEALKGIGDWYVDNASHDDGDGIYWSGNTSVLLDSGVVLFLLDAQDVLQDSRLEETILKAGKRILRTADETPDGGVRFDIFKGIEDFIEPGFELGSAGVGYLLVKLYEHTHDDTYLNGAKKVDKHLDTLLVKQERGALLPYRFNRETGQPLVEENQIVYYLGNCHGPAGTSKFYYELAQATGDKTYLGKITELVDGLESLGAPDQQTNGLWNSVNLCCGHAGLIHFFIGLYAADGDDRWLDLARRSAAVVLGQEEILPNGSSDWPLAFTRIEPDVYSRPIGYYTGSAGIAASLLELYTLETGEYHWLRLADDPFPERQTKN